MRFNLKSELADLQGAFASQQFRDELKRIERRRRFNKTSITRYRGDGIMVKQLLQIRIRIDGCKNHKLPHVHVDYGRNRHAASFAVHTGGRLAGRLNSKYDRPMQDWITRNRAKLLEAWETLQRGEDTDEIVAELREAR